MSNKLSRIILDKKRLLLNPLTEQNIFIIHDEENINISRALIIGPEDTPYEDGFYLFEFLFPSNYPFQPFKVKFFTNNGITRMHPNFYACGKVCVSIIGTWTGPGWTSCQTLESVLVTFQSLFIKNPLHQEPGFENNFTSKNSNYNNIIHHENINIGIIKMYNNIPKGFEGFKPIMEEYLLQNKKRILNKCKSNIIKEISSPSIWNFKIKLDYQSLNKELLNIYTNLNTLDITLTKKIIEKCNILEKGEHISYPKAIKMISKMDVELNEHTILTLMEMKKIVKIKNGIVFKE